MPESSCNKETAQESSITQSNCHINIQNIKQVSYKPTSITKGMHLKR
jgi:hypothetical protein